MVNRPDSSPGVVARPTQPERAAAPLLSRNGLLIAIALAFALVWPCLLFDGPLVFHDTAAYLSGGARALDYATTLLGRLLETGAPGDGASADGTRGGAGNVSDVGDVRGLRSIPYSLFAFGTAQSPVGVTLLAVAQTALVLMMAFALATRETLREQCASRTLVLAVALGGLTTLPWYAAYAMPDILAAAIPLYAVLLIRGLTDFNLAQKLLLAGIATFAIAGHYGNVPLAAGVFGAAFLVLLMQRRLRLNAVLLGLGPLLLVIGFNYMAGLAMSGGGNGSSVSSGSGSIAPKRLPVMLARSIEDGPARWHLEAACADGASYALCEIFDRIPENIHSLMWAKDGLKRATPQQYARVADEELLVLWRAFQEYPLTQTWALVGNAARQVFKFGVDDLFPARSDDPSRPDIERAKSSALLDVFDELTLWTSILAYIALLGAGVYWRAWRNPLVAGCLFVLLAGFALNAVIFGGLSAPVDRYQSRLVWIIWPVLFVLSREAAAIGGGASPLLRRRSK